MEDSWALCSQLFNAGRGVLSPLSEFSITGLAFEHLCLKSFFPVVNLCAASFCFLLPPDIHFKVLSSGWAASWQGIALVLVSLELAMGHVHVYCTLQ